MTTDEPPSTSSRLDNTETIVVTTPEDNRSNDSTRPEDPEEEEGALELRIARVVEALAQIDRGLHRPRQPLDFLGIPKARHVLDALAAILSSDDMNYAVTYTVTCDQLVILIAADHPVHQDKVIFVDTVLAKGRQLLAKDKNKERTCIELRSRDLKDLDVVDFFRYTVKFDFSTFKHNFTSHQAIINEFHQHSAHIPMSSTARARLARFRYLYDTTARRLREIDAELKDPAKLFDDNQLLAMWVLVVYSLGDIKRSEWMEIDRWVQEHCSQLVLIFSHAPISACIQQVTLVFRRAITLEMGLRNPRTRRLLNRPYRVTKIDTMPSVAQFPKAMSKAEWIDFLKPMINTETPVGKDFVDELATKLSSDGADGIEQARPRPVIHAELKLLAFFRVNKQWCSRIVVTGKPCIACCIILECGLNAKERHSQHIKPRQGCTPGWVLPVGILSEDALERSYNALCARLEQISLARMERNTLPLVSAPTLVVGPRRPSPPAAPPSLGSGFSDQSMSE